MNPGGLSPLPFDRLVVGKSIPSSGSTRSGSYTPPLVDISSRLDTHAIGTILAGGTGESSWVGYSAGLWRVLVIRWCPWYFPDHPAYNLSPDMSVWSDFINKSRSPNAAQYYFFYIQVQKEAKLYWSVKRFVSSDLPTTYHQGLSHLHPPCMVMPFQFTLNNAIFKDTLDYMREYLCITSL